MQPEGHVDTYHMIRFSTVPHRERNTFSGTVKSTHHFREDSAFANYLIMTLIKKKNKKKPYCYFLIENMTHQTSK